MLFGDEEAENIDQRLSQMNPFERFFFLEKLYGLNDYYSVSGTPAPETDEDIIFELQPRALLCLDISFPDLDLSSGE